MPRPWLVPTLALLLAAPAAPLDPDVQREHDQALHDWSLAVGTVGYAWGAPVLELAIAEYRQSTGIGPDLAGPRGVFAHAMGGRLPSHETAWRTAPDPDVLVSSAWLDLAPEPAILFVPPLQGRWYSVRVVDAYGELAGSLSPKTSGSVGGWHVIAPAGFEAPLPPRVQGVLRSPTSSVWVIVEVAASPRDEAVAHERYQARFKLLPLGVYRRSPAGAEFASMQPQTGAPTLRATAEMRGSLDAFRVINQRLRRIEPVPGAEALLALFDRAGFGPRVTLDPARLEPTRLTGLRDAARNGRSSLAALRRLRTAQPGWQAPPAADPADPVRRAVRGLGVLPASEVLVLEAHRDADGRRLDGRSDYRLRFAADALPPVEASWSLAAYASESERLFDTDGERTWLGSATEGLRRDDDGALQLWLSSDAPEDPALRANWLPVGTEPFFLVARLRAPGPTALDGSWKMPPVEPAD